MKELDIKEMRNIQGGNIVDPVDVLLFFLNGGRYWIGL